MVDATVNADGWGAGWFDASGRTAVYRQTLPIWADGNVDALGRSLYGDTWMANVRSATPGLGTGHANTQPFADDRVLFLHNGFIGDFAQTLRARIRAELDPAIETLIQGNTDSEYLFALMRQQSGPMAERLGSMFCYIKHCLDEMDSVRALLNFIVTDGRQLVAVRGAVRAGAPSLYVNHDWHGGVVVASEAFDDDSGWTPVACDEIVTLDRPGLTRSAAT